MRQKNCKKDSHKHRDRAESIAPVVPGVRFEHLTANFLPRVPRIAEEDFFHDYRGKRHDGNRHLRMGRFARQERQDGLIANPHANGGNGKANRDGNKRLESAVPVGVFRIRRRVPEVAPDNDGDISHKIRRAVDSIGDKRLGIAQDAHHELGPREGGVPAKPHPSHFADFCAIVLFAYASHTV